MEKEKKETYQEAKKKLQKKSLDLNKLSTLLIEKLNSEKLSYRQAELITGVTHTTIRNIIAEKQSPSLINGLLICEFIQINPINLIK